VGAVATDDDINPDLIDASRRPVTLLPGVSISEHTVLFAMIRGGHLGGEHMRTLRALLCLALPALLACPLPAPAQKYPEKSIRLVVGFSTGAPYVLALVISEKLRESLGQSVVPDFRAGAAGNIAPELVAKRPLTVEQVPRALARGCDPVAGCTRRS